MIALSSLYSVVNTNTTRSVLLSYKNNTGSPWIQLLVRQNHSAVVHSPVGQSHQGDDEKSVGSVDTTSVDCMFF